MTRTVLSWLLTIALGIGVFFSFTAQHQGMVLHEIAGMSHGEEGIAASTLCLLHCMIANDHDVSESLPMLTSILFAITVVLVAFVVVPRWEFASLRLRARSPSPLRGTYLLSVCKRE